MDLYIGKTKKWEAIHRQCYC